MMVCPRFTFLWRAMEYFPYSIGGAVCGTYRRTVVRLYRLHAISIAIGRNFAPLGSPSQNNKI